MKNKMQFKRYIHIKKYNLKYKHFGAKNTNFKKNLTSS